MPSVQCIIKKYISVSTPRFQHLHPANRIELSHGRDLVLDPGPASGPINFLAYPVLEVDGEPLRMASMFLFRRAGHAQGD
jgi:hypothetical protein